MQVPDAVRKCVAFVCYRQGGNFKLAGTAFFVGEEFADFKGGWGLTVTARHVIDGIRKHSDDQKVYLRLNLRDGGVGNVESHVDDWRFHRDGKTVDVAVWPWAPPLEQFDHLVYNMTGRVATKEFLRDESIGVGDELFITGLFAPHYGDDTRNVPIVRVGNIAAMPETPVITKDLGPIEAYLIEARSIGGLSGSPVFVNLGLHRTTPNGSGFTFHRIAIHLLGVMHGHFQLPETDTDPERVNMGIGLVVPIGKVLEVLQLPEFKAMKKTRQKEAHSAGEATMDTAVDSDAEFQRFEDLTRKLVKIPKTEIAKKPKGK